MPFKSKRGLTHEEEKLGLQINKEVRSLAHGGKRIKYWVEREI